ncbi:Flp family type IVb pilin [Aeromicrobium sp. 50.2.37]|uniref:Flp family type IVb pilin n=1 Tax=Aeromicrobium sp. 50.2.37 TaxID=2969305 RepID=UPI002150659E|nr:Flp family type IVb pilin [Aeromicrobium sp. 50.2.37]MCR4514974.1 Flp family type IVb pilin [Aeromicrobium sp. 50.2.37]
MYALSTVIAYLTTAKIRRDERGATAVEYGLLVALIAGVIIAVVLTLGGKISGAFSGVNSQLPAAPAASATP